MAELAGVLGAGVRHEGDLVFKGRVRIDGELVGEVRTDDLVDVSEGALVEGSVTAAQILVAGTVQGLLRASERITLLPTAHVTGRVETPWLDVRNGAVLRGDVLVWRERP